MLSKRDYLLMLALFVTAFVLFMSVNVGTDLLTKSNSPQPDYEKSVQARQATVDSSKLDLNQTKASKTAAGSILSAATVAIVVPETDTRSLGWFTEWCTYQKYRYSVFSSLPTAEELSDFDIVLIGELPLSASDLPSLEALTEEERTVIFTQLPDYDVLAKSPGLQNYFGIRKCVQADYPLKSVHLLKDFFVSQERIYDKKAMYDDSRKIELSENYYLLRSGFQIFIQGVPADSSVSYYDFPSLMWETRTGNANLFVVNTDLFDSKAMLGVLCAMMAQTQPYYLYPVVDAQTISVLNFPLFASENKDVLMRMYSRDSISLTHDSIWPSVDKIFLTYQTVPSFFMTPRLDYDNTANDTDDTMVSFYRRGIFKRMGALGLSTDQVSQLSLADKAAQDASFLKDNFSDLLFTAAYAARERLSEFLTLMDSSSVYVDTSVVLTDYDESEPLLSMSEDGALIASFTENGYRHTIQDDIRMIGLETALGLNNQQIDIKQVLYPETDADTWNYYSNQWSKAVTYQNDFTAFERLSVTGMGKKSANFLSIQYSIEELADGIRLHIQSLDDETSFMLRLSGIAIEDAENVTYESITDSAYLLHCTGDTVELHFKDTYRLEHTPSETLEVGP